VACAPFRSLIWINALCRRSAQACLAIVAAMASAREVIMTMQSGRNGRGGLANNLTLQLTLLAAAVVLVLYLAAHYIW
jgi:hypothetical protein